MSKESESLDRSSDANLLFGVLALQADYIDIQQFVDACLLWSAKKQRNLADILVQQGWLDADGRAAVESFVLRNSARNKTDSTSPFAKAARPADDDLKLLAGPLKPTNIELRGVHSTGGIGQVWLAHDQVLDRDIALKELRLERADDELARERFLREAQITAQLNHPGTVPVHEYREESGRAFYTMKFLKGRTLTEVCEEHHRQKRDGAAVDVSLIELLNHFLSICNTIAYSHDRDIIHRDLKGDNVIVGDFGEVTVIDWGLAKQISTGETRFGDTLVFTATEVASSRSRTIQGQPLGTPAYMSPEQARGEIDNIDFRSDVYGLAAILYEILAGVPPFLGGDLMRLIRAVESETPVPPSRHARDVPETLEKICLQGLAKNPDDRQQSAMELRGQVQAWITDQAERKRTEQERERFFSLSLDLLVVFDADARFRQVNPAVEQILGWSVKEFLQMPVSEVTHPEDWPRTEAAITKVFSGQTVTEFEERDRCKDGTYRWMQWNASLIEGEQLIYAVGRDVTERRQSEQMFRGLLESAPDAMVISDTNRRVQLVNSRTESLFGYARGELLGQSLEILLPERFRGEHPAQFAAFIAERKSRPMGTGMTLIGQRADGSEFPIEISLSPVETENGLLVSIAIRDASEASGAAN